MATRDLAHALRHATQPGDPLTLDEASSATGADYRRASAALTYLGQRGEYVRVRQRLWVRSDGTADPYRLGARIAVPYAFVYGSALELHGASSAPRSEVLVSTPGRFDAFEFDGLAYRRASPWSPKGLVKVSVGPESVWVTNPERTLVDCVRVPTNAGGITELLRSAAALTRLRPDELLFWVDHYSEGVLASRLGFLIETLDRPPDEWQVLAKLERRRTQSRAYLDGAQRGGRLNRRWNLIVPKRLARPRSLWNRRLS